MATIDESAPLPATVKALQAHLQRFFPPAQFSFSLVPEQASPEIWAELTRRPPFVGLSWAGLKPDQDSGRNLLGSFGWALTLLTKHSDIEKRYLGDATMPALLNMVWMASVALSGHALVTPDGLPLGTITVTGGSNAYASNWGKGQVALAALEFTTPIPQPGDAFNAHLPDFLTLGVTWKFEGNAVATDELERPA